MNDAQLKLADLTPDDPDVRHLEELGLVEWKDGRLQVTRAGALAYAAYVEKNVEAPSHPTSQPSTPGASGG